MKLSRYDEDKHYDMMAEAWKAYGWEAPKRDFLPNLGIVATKSQDGGFLAYIGCYQDNGGHVGFIDWALANPNEPGDLVDCALRGCWELIEKIAKINGMKYLYSVTANSAWGRKMVKSFDMIRAEKDAATYIKSLVDGVSIDFMK